MENQNRELAEHVFQLTFEMTSILTKVAAEHDFSLTQLRLLGVLRDRSLKMGEVANYLGLDKSSITGIITRSEKCGLVVRTPAPDDKRALIVSLTEKGQALDNEIMSQLLAIEAKYEVHLTVTERERLHLLLHKFMNGNVDQNDLGRR